MGKTSLAVDRPWMNYLILGLLGSLVLKMGMKKAPA
jgi:hypothetical protein